MSVESNPGRKLSAGGAFLALAISACFAPTACSSYSGTTDEGEVTQSSEALSTTSITEAGDELRTGFYGNQPRLSPSIVTSGTFGQLFSATVTGQVYAQPLVSQGTLLIVTETNDIYGLDPESGATRWHRSDLGTAFDAAGTLGCNDLTPAIGVTGTPVIDSATNTAYFFAKVVQSGVTKTVAHAIDVATGAEKPNFPVNIAGPASNAPGLNFDSVHHLQRPGLLLLGNKVYAAFGAHCDAGPWQGWIVGVSKDGTSQTRWVANTTADGAGIWQSGGGIMSDSAGRMYVATGNGGAPAPSHFGSEASTLPNLGEAVVRVDVQADGSLRAADFFAPTDAQQLDSFDADFASGAPVGLPDSFGTTAFPHLLVAVGKQGYVYLLNRDNLGGIGTGANGTDAYVSRSGLNGGVWSKPAVWPGDGGYVYVPTASAGPASAGSVGLLYAYKRGLDAAGKPTLDVAAKSTDGFGFSSSRPIVTANGTTSGTAIVWIVWSPGGTGTGSQLRGYKAVPNASGSLDELFRAPIGQSAKFNPPGVGDGRIYVGTRDGHVLGFGSPVTPVLTASPAQFTNVVVGSTAVTNVTITANQALTIQTVQSSSPDFTVGTPVQATLAQGASTTVPVTFKPTSPGLKGASLIVSTSAGSASTSLSGTALSSSALLQVSAPVVSFGGTPVNTPVTQPLTITNIGATTLVLQSFTQPTGAFSVVQLPANGKQLAPNESVTLTLRFAPTTLGTFGSTFGITSNGGSASIGLTGTCAAPGHLTVTPLAVDFGRVALGSKHYKAFQVSNTGGLPLQITKSKPPVQGSFAAVTELAEGSVLAVNQTVTELVTYTPTAQGGQDDVWQLNSTGDNGPLQVAFHGDALSGITSSSVTGWKFNGTATGAANLFTLTQANAGEGAGSAFWTTSLPSSALDVSFDTTIGNGSGADGMALVVADAATQTPSSLGAAGGGLGFLGIRGIALALDTYQNGTDPSGNFVGLTNGPVSTTNNDFNWLATSTNVPPLRDGIAVTRHIRLYTANPGATPSIVVVEVDGLEVIRQSVTLPSSVYVGFSGGNGGFDDLHAVSNVSIVTQQVTSSTTASVLGFENASQWTVSAGTVSSSGIVSQGAAALGVSGFYYTELSSTPLSSLGAVGSTLSVDIRPPLALSYGTVQLYVDAPSAQIYTQYLGQASLAGAAANSYRTVSFAIPASVLSKLQGSFTDLRLKLTVNAPVSSSPYLFDNIRFGG
ncbi:MAG TPA: choice-of-anchor D domain-containing protein [Polyangiaceae bacterium]|nr:choice-of-anchor D domain-containing protein [Polyangiaceae bacterium]